jgi:hypothetical protein
MIDATMIVPIGDFTPEVARRVRETAVASAQQRDVVISLASTLRYSWSALNEFAEALRAAVTPHRIRLTHSIPRQRALFHTLGIEQAWFVEVPSAPAATQILIRA